MKLIDYEPLIVNPIMKMNNNKILLTMFFMLFVFIAYAQKAPPLPGPTPPGLILPIDGGLSFLIIVGAAFGVYKLRKKE